MAFCRKKDDRPWPKFIKIEKSLTNSNTSYRRVTLRAINMDFETIRDRIQQIESKRDSLVRLLEQPDLGTLRIDVNQAIEEMDDLLDEFKRTFPANN